MYPTAHTSSLRAARTVWVYYVMKIIARNFILHSITHSFVFHSVRSFDGCFNVCAERRSAKPSSTLHINEQQCVCMNSPAFGVRCGAVCTFSALVYEQFWRELGALMVNILCVYVMCCVMVCCSSSNNNNQNNRMGFCSVYVCRSN